MTSLGLQLDRALSLGVNVEPCQNGNEWACDGILSNTEWEEASLAGFEGSGRRRASFSGEGGARRQQTALRVGGVGHWDATPWERERDPGLGGRQEEDEMRSLGKLLGPLRRRRILKMGRRHHKTLLSGQQALEKKAHHHQ